MSEATPPRLHLVRWAGNRPVARCGTALSATSRWVAVVAYFHHPKYQPGVERCRNCKRAQP